MQPTRLRQHERKQTSYINSDALIQNLDTNTLHHIAGLKKTVMKNFYVYVNNTGIT
jgi:hypothetical protein